MTEYSSHPKNPNFQREQHTCTLKCNINEVYPSCTSKRIFQQRRSLSRFLVHYSVGLLGITPYYLFSFSFYNKELCHWKWADIMKLLHIAIMFTEDYHCNCWTVYIHNTATYMMSDYSIWRWTWPLLQTLHGDLGHDLYSRELSLFYCHETAKYSSLSTKGLGFFCFRVGFLGWSFVRFAH